MNLTERFKKAQMEAQSSKTSSKPEDLNLIPAGNTEQKRRVIEQLIAHAVGARVGEIVHTQVDTQIKASDDYQLAAANLIGDESIKFHNLLQLKSDEVSSTVEQKVKASEAYQTLMNGLKQLVRDEVMARGGKIDDALIAEKVNAAIASGQVKGAEEVKQLVHALTFHEMYTLCLNWDVEKWLKRLAAKQNTTIPDIERWFNGQIAKGNVHRPFLPRSSRVYTGPLVVPPQQSYGSQQQIQPGAEESAQQCINYWRSTYHFIDFLASALKEPDIEHKLWNLEQECMFLRNWTVGARIFDINECRIPEPNDPRIVNIPNPFRSA